MSNYHGSQVFAAVAELGDELYERLVQAANAMDDRFEVLFQRTAFRLVIGELQSEFRVTLVPKEDDDS